MDNNTYTFTLTKNAIVNLIVDYADHLLDLREDEPYVAFANSTQVFTEDYAYDTGFCAAAELWMKALGISPESNMVQDIINIIEKRRELDEQN